MAFNSIFRSFVFSFYFSCSSRFIRIMFVCPFICWFVHLLVCPFIFWNLGQLIWGKQNTASVSEKLKHIFWRWTSKLWHRWQYHLTTHIWQKENNSSQEDFNWVQCNVSNYSAWTYVLSFFSFLASWCRKNPT